MKKIICIPALLLISFVSFSQVGFGIKGGLNISKPKGIVEPKTARFAGYGGARLYVPLGNSKFSFDPELLFSAKGFTDDWIDNERKVFSYNYLTLPILFSYRFDCKTRLMAGGEVAYLLSENDDYLHTHTKNFDFGLAIGVDHEVAKRLHAEIRYVYGITKINSSSYDGTTYHNGNNRVFQIGMVYDLKNKQK
ncbi:MAG TPA: porin family protein [Phnomibacter sp.]|nr:porin family protein [Phnomibacter sp.]